MLVACQPCVYCLHGSLHWEQLRVDGVHGVHQPGMFGVRRHVHWQFVRNNAMYINNRQSVHRVSGLYPRGFF